ncbi:MAG: peptidoglycan DD-metalloendopeptidase family protein [Kangiellaceae bacterium]
MIKHDYKPQNSKRIFKKGFFDRLPPWATHPYLILSTAAFFMLLAYLLSSDTEQPISNEIEINKAQKSLSDDDIESGDIPLNVSAPKAEPIASVSALSSSKEISMGDNYSDPIEIPLQLSAFTSAESDLSTLNSEPNWRSEAVKKGDNLSKIFKRIGLSPQLLYKIVNLDENTAILTKLKPGEIIHYQLSNDKQLTALKYIIDLQNTLYINQLTADDESGKDYASNIVNKTIETRTAYVSGQITDSLFMAGKKAGLTDTLVINLANIFAWDIDFILDIRKGDSFSLLYEEQYLDGEKIGDGNILAAEFINRSEVYRAIRYTDSNDNTSYYSDEGRSMRKAFLRAPVNFKYISDSFNPRRFHPVQKRIKPHRGIDYAAPVGTPIRAAGDGKVIESGYNRFNGKYVFIQHGNNIVTKYLHLSKRLVSRGKRVKQGQTIGKLGRTGMVTGPHLHYEFVVNGVHRNPRTVKLPKAEPISKKEKPNFMVASRSLISQLEARKNIQSSAQVAR